jgi:hypothetical protein
MPFQKSNSPRTDKFTELTPVHFFSHGSTMMLGEESESAAYWKKCGDEALANNIKGVIIMVAITSTSVPQPSNAHRELTGTAFTTRSK